MSSNLDKSKNTLVRKNYIFNLLYQIFLVIVPLIVTPYVSRTLSPEGIGQYGFSYSLITYFTIIGSLGFGFYAQREIAMHQNDYEKQSKIFWEINLCRFVFVAISMALNFILCFLNVYKQYTDLMLVFSINIFALAFDISFFFQGNEQFGKLVLRNVIIKTISIILIFTLVKEKNDLLIYAIINSLMLIVSNLSLWTYLPKILKKVKINSLRPFRHLKGTLRLFIPTIASTIYTVLDRTLLGLIINENYIVIENGVEVIKRYADLEIGYYEQSEKLVKMALTVITCLSAVMISRNTDEIAKGNDEQVKTNIYGAFNLIWLIGLPMCVGMASISDFIVPWFYGDGYEKCSILISIFSILILAIGISNIFGLHFLIPYGEDNKFSLALILGAVINLVLNAILIPFYWSVGATIASVIAELSISIIMYFMVRNRISIKKCFSNIWKYLLASLLMLIVILIMKYYISISFINTLLIIIASVLVYFLTLVILREKNILMLLIKLKRK